MFVLMDAELRDWQWSEQLLIAWQSRHFIGLLMQSSVVHIIIRFMINFISFTIVSCQLFHIFKRLKGWRRDRWAYTYKNTLSKFVKRSISVCEGHTAGIAYMPSLKTGSRKYSCQATPLPHSSSSTLLFFVFELHSVRYTCAPNYVDPTFPALLLGVIQQLVCRDNCPTVIGRKKF